MALRTRIRKKSAQKTKNNLKTTQQTLHQVQTEPTQDSVIPDYGVLNGEESLTPDVVRSLQTTHGNHYVQRLVQTHEPANTEVPAFIRSKLSSTPIKVQRRVPEEARTDPLLNDPNAQIASINLEGYKTAIKRMMNNILNADLIKWLKIDLGIKDKLGKDSSTILKGNDVTELKALLKELSAVVNKQSFVEFPTADQSFVTPTGTKRDDLKKGIERTQKVLREIATGSHDQHLKDVFGTHATFGWDKTKPKFKEASIWLKKMFDQDKIGADRSGENEQIGLGGMTSFHGRILLEASAMDDPTSDESVILIAHEAAHTGNNDVHDTGGYRGMEGFDKKSQQLKFTTAAYYEEVVARVLNHNPHAVKVFVPDTGSSSGGGGGMTHFQRAASKAADQFREAWDNAVDVFFLFKGEFRRQEANAAHTMSASKRKTLLFNSTLMNLTFHQRHAVDSTSKVNLLDLVMAEGAARLYAQAGGFIKKVAPADATDIIVQIIHPEFADPANEGLLVKYIVEGVLKEVGSITGSTARDVEATRILNIGDSILSTQDAPPTMP